MASPVLALWGAADAIRMDPREAMMDQHSQELAYEALRWVIAPLLRRGLSWIDFVGAENVPEKGPALLVSNHRSVLDPLLIGLGLKRPVHFIADAWLGHVAIAPILAAAGVIFLPSAEHRSQALLEAGKRALEDGQLVGIFPEGMDNFLSDTEPGSVGPFHTAFARLWYEMRDLEVPIVPVAILGAEEERMRIPGRWFRALDPHNSRFYADGVRLVLYQGALIRYGRPLCVPFSGSAAEGIRAIAEATRQRIAEMRQL